jgi:hypothetical protein
VAPAPHPDRGFLFLSLPVSKSVTARLRDSINLFTVFAGLK